MAHANVEVVRRALVRTEGVDIAVLRDDAAWAQGRTEREALYPADCSFVWYGGGGTVGLEGTGVDAFRGAWLELFEAWKSVRVEYERLIPVGGAVVALVRGHGRLVGTESEVVNYGAAVYSVQDGRIVRVESYANRSDALEAEGLRG
jgi:ketosteroid isomerase-like protein